MAVRGSAPLGNRVGNWSAVEGPTLGSVVSESEVGCTSSVVLIVAGVSVMSDGKAKSVALNRCLHPRDVDLHHATAGAGPKCPGAEWICSYSSKLMK